MWEPSMSASAMKTMIEYLSFAIWASISSGVASGRNSPVPIAAVRSEISALSVASCAFLPHVLSGLPFSG
jgi:hypothetical protein